MFSKRKFKDKNESSERDGRDRDRMDRSDHTGALSAKSFRNVTAIGQSFKERRRVGHSLYFFLKKKCKIPEKRSKARQVLAAERVLRDGYRIPEAKLHRHYRSRRHRPLEKRTECSRGLHDRWTGNRQRTRTCLKSVPIFPEITRLLKAWPEEKKPTLKKKQQKKKNTGFRLSDDSGLGDERVGEGELP